MPRPGPGGLSKAVPAAPSAPLCAVSYAPRSVTAPFSMLASCSRLLPSSISGSVGTKQAKTQRFLAPSARRRHRPTLVVDPRSSACLGRHGAVLGHHTCSLGDLDAHPRARPPPLTSFARKATRAGGLQALRRLKGWGKEEANAISALLGHVRVPSLCLNRRSSPPFVLWSCNMLMSNTPSKQGWHESNIEPCTTQTPVGRQRMQPR